MILNFTRKKSNIHGWGLFADAFIPNNTVIEECTYIIATGHLPVNIHSHTFPNLNGKGLVIPKGYASLLNSSSIPNCKFTMDIEFLTISTIKDIEAGEELTLQY